MSKMIIELEEQTTTFKDSVTTRYIVAVLGAWCAEFVTYPLDMVKTRLQIQNELATRKLGFKMENRGFITAVVHIATKEGPLKLWSGLLPMCQRHVIYSGGRLVFYERMRRFLRDEQGKMSLGRTVFCGATSGAFAQLIASPCDMVKIQMQSEGRRLMQGMPSRFNGCWNVYKVIYHESGITGFWRGAVPNMQRAAMVNIGLSTYDYSKQLLIANFELKDDVFLHSLSAFSAGFIVAVLGTPADVIKTRLMNQPVGPDGRGKLYKGTIDCIRQSVANEGILALYKGFLPMWFRLGPWALVYWLAFENIMVIMSGKSS